jgi:fluoride exporter
MKEFALVFVGGGIGSMARYLLGRLLIPYQVVFPFATLAANFLSCFIFGLAVMLGVEKINLTQPLKLLVLTGFCGGFSTYSAFTFETIELFKSGHTLSGLSNIVLNLLLSISAFYLGISTARAF